MTTEACYCRSEKAGRPYGDDPAKYPELVEESSNGRFPVSLVVRCRICGKVWQVDQIPYGGIYGDFEWQPID